MSSYFSVTFLLLFLPVTVGAYAIAPQRLRWAVLLAASYMFAWSMSETLIVFLLATTATTYATGVVLGVLIKRRNASIEENPSEKRQLKKKYTRAMRRVLAAGIAIGFTILVTLKYLGFFGEVATSLLALVGIQTTFVAPKIGVTIGISFYTLMAASYLVDVYRETVPADANLGRLALFLCFFPQIMEGPICRHGQTANALWEGREITRQNLRYGALRVAWGFTKKIIVADRLNLFVKPVFDNYAGLDGSVIVLGAILYTLQLYCDFSGCMDVALGTARIFNVPLPENFRQPFFSKTASEFWQRWHITLGAWFKDYVYYPISLSKPVKKLTSRARKCFGNRYGPLLTSGLALLCVWLGNGLWHGAGSQYLFFGIYYFVLIWAGGFIEPVANALAQRLGVNRDSALYRTMRIARTLVVVFLGEMFFRANSFSDGIAMLVRAVTTLTFQPFASGAVLSMGMDSADFIVVAVFALLVLAHDIARERGLDIVDSVAKHKPRTCWTVWTILLLSTILFGAYGYGYAPVDPMYAQY